MLNFANVGLHIIRFPSGRFGYVGSVPAELGEEVPATKSDVLGCRAYRNPASALCVVRFPSFDTEAAAREFAEARGFTPAPTSPRHK